MTSISSSGSTSHNSRRAQLHDGGSRTWCVGLAASVGRAKLCATTLNAASFASGKALEGLVLHEIVLGNRREDLRIPVYKPGCTVVVVTREPRSLKLCPNSHLNRSHASN